ncbi:hypothetical protein JB92DRAFT_2890355 [Gautieria morchelliformis]|nr:hypothetical protein JB92DRAFT_2890355 [Gautieria morchelliformis]
MPHNTASLVHTPLLRLPREIIELIVLNVVGLSNLLSLGLTCKVLAGILFSGHIQYYTVRAPIRRVDTWKHLIRNRTYARSVRHLEIILDTIDSDSFRPVKFLEDRGPDNGQYPPGPSSQIPSELERDMWCERLVAIALRGMSNLRSLAWLRACPPILSGPEDIWSALCQKQYLSDVKLRELGYHAPSYAVSPPKDMEINIRSLLISPISTTFFGLVKFDLTCFPIPFKGPATLLPVVDLLVSHCPHLENLTIMVKIYDDYQTSDLNMDNLFLLGKWPRLRILQLENITLSPTPVMGVAVGSFFSNNLAIRHLLCIVCRNDHEIPDIIFPPNCLPHLTFLYAEDPMIRAILSSPCSTPRPLEKLHGLTLDRAIWEQPDSSFQGVNKDALLAVNIRTIQRPDDLQLLGMLFPCIEYLDLEEVLCYDDMGYARCLSMADCANKLRSFQNLRALYGSPLSSDDLEEEIQANIVLLADIFPRLVFVDGPVDSTEIIRGADGLTWRATTNPWLVFDNPDPYMIEE